MNQKNIFIIILFVLTVYVVKAQEVRINSIKINPFSFIVANTSVFYERGITPHSSCEIGINYFNAAIYKAPVSGYGISLEYRYHPKKSELRPLNGFYLSPFVRYQDYSFSRSITLKDLSGKTILDFSGGVSMSQYAIGGMIGYEHIAKKGFTFDIYFGPFYNTTTFSASLSKSIINIPLYSVPISGFWVRSGIIFGYTF
jgi:hypothetical protein